MIAHVLASLTGHADNLIDPPVPSRRWTHPRHAPAPRPANDLAKGSPGWAPTGTKSLSPERLGACDLGALGGTRTPNLLIRSVCHASLLPGHMPSGSRGCRSLSCVICQSFSVSRGQNEATGSPLAVPSLSPALPGDVAVMVVVGDRRSASDATNPSVLHRSLYVASSPLVRPLVPAWPARCRR